MRTLILLTPFIALTSFSAPAEVLLRRSYVPGEELKYVMTGKNQQNEYTAVAHAVVKQVDQAFAEEFRWSNLIYNGKAIVLPQQSLAFRQTLSLDPHFQMTIPNVSAVHPKMTGPIFDLLTFYSDIWLVIENGGLKKVSDHFYVPHNKPNSWADGLRVIIGEDSIDFDLTLTGVNASQNTAKILIKHVPPKYLSVNLPAPWMNEQIGSRPNNWVQVRKISPEKYVAAAGEETFDVEVILELDSGKIRSALMKNPVYVLERECSDQALTVCGPIHRNTIYRQIEINLTKDGNSKN